MMIHSYPEMYLGDVMDNLGYAFDFAVSDCKVKGQQFLDMMAISNAAHQIEHGNPKYLCGLSGIEIADEILTGHKIKEKEAVVKFGRSVPFWIGWSLAYYQWESGKSFKMLSKAATYDDLVNMYPTLHEADVTKFADYMTERINKFDALSE